MFAPTDSIQNATGFRLGIAVSGYHAEVTERLLAGAVETFRSAGGNPDDLVIAPTPGAFELTAVAHALVTRGLEGVLTLGCIVRGETFHDEILAHAVANGLTQITVQTGVPICFGVLTCPSLAHAIARAGGAEGNKGEEGMAALLTTIATRRSLAGHPAGVPT